jgi:protein O-GlcNAc transferase
MRRQNSDDISHNGRMNVIAKLKLGTQHHQAGRLKAAEAVYEDILHEFPDQPDALHLTGLVSHQQGDVDRAVGLIKRAIHQRSTHPVYLKNLCVVLTASNRVEEAATNYRTLVDIVPHDIDAWIGLGNSCQHVGRLDDAIEAYRQAVHLRPSHSGAYHNMGAAYHARGDHRQALLCLQAALRIDPGSAQIQYSLGRVYISMGNIDEAIRSIQQAIEINADYIEARFNLANLFKDVGKFQAAAENYMALLKIAPAMAEAHNNLGNVLLSLNQDDQALKCYQAAIEINPDYPEAWQNISIVSQNNGDYEAAMENCKKAITIEPGYEPAFASLAHQMRQACVWDGLEKIDRKLDQLTRKALSEGRQPAENPFLNITRHADPAANLAVAQAWSRNLSTRVKAVRSLEKSEAGAQLPTRSKAGHLKIGYLSNNFRNHPTAHLLIRLFGLHDRKQFKTYAYSYGQDDASDYRKRIETDCDHFVDLREMNDCQAADRIRTDRINILVDLVGYMQGHRLGICARRPAPVQVRYLGMAGTSGADFFDYLIADRVVVPEEQTRYYSEKLVYLPHSYQINDDRQSIAHAGYTKTDFNLPADTFIYCSFASHYKLDSKMFSAWMRILRQTDPSALWLTPGSKTAERNLIIQAKARDVDPERLVFTHRLPKEDHLARLKLADLALDTRLVGGAATTSDALWAGVPVVTMQGGHFASRMSASLLNAIRLEELIVSNLDEYEALAVRLRCDGRWLESVRQKLNTQKASTPLFATVATTGHLESAYTAMWEIFEKGEKARMIEL